MNHVGQQIGSYRLQRSLGEGGFAEVYLGMHLYLKHLAAIKILHAHLAGQDAKQFLAEALTLAGLVHPNIVRIRDFAVQDGIPFLVMDYVPGGSLRQHHPEGIPLSLEQVVLYVKHVASALQYAHDKQVIHRDVKPENMLLTAEGEVVLSDFGIAVMPHHADQLQKQKVAGTPAYMAPEVISGKACAASDQYALGISVYEWLCGELPFRGSALHIMSQQKNRPVPPLREKVPTLPSAVERVVLKALAKDPQQRFDTVQQFAEALEYACQQSLARTTIALTTTMPLGKSPLIKDLLTGKLPPRHKRMTRRGMLIALGGIAVAGGVAVAGVAAAGDVPWVLATFLHIGPPPSGYHGHSAPVRSLAWSPDGKLVASASDDATVQVWNPTGLQTTLTYRQHKGSVSAVAWSPDGRRVASGGHDGTTQVWDATTGELLSPRGGAFGNVNAVAWSADNQFCAVAYDETIQIWDRKQGIVSFLYTRHSDIVRALCWSPGGQHIASGDNQGNLYIWDTISAQERFSKIRSYALNIVTWSPDGAWVAFGGDGGTIEIVDAITGVNHTTCHGQAAVLAAAWSPDSKRLVTLDLAETAWVWDAVTGKLLGKYAGQLKLGERAVPAIAWSPDSTRIVQGFYDGTIKIWDATTGAVKLTYHGHTHAVQSVAWSAYDTRIASAGAGEEGVQVWDTVTGGLIYRYSSSSAQIQGVAWLADGAQVAASGDDGNILVWKTGDTSQTIESYGNYGAIHCLTWSPLGRYLAVGNDKLLLVKDMITEKVTTAYLDNARPILSVAWAPDENGGGGYIALAGPNKYVQILRTADDQEAYRYRHLGAVNAVAWSPTGKQLVSGSFDISVMVWDMQTNKVILTYKGHSAAVNAVAWSPDGIHIASGSDDGTVQVWEAATGKLIFTYRAHTDKVNAVVWSPDGKSIASGSSDMTVQVWSPE